MTMAASSTLPGSCARAASAAEARFRIDRPIVAARAARIIGLDDRAEQVVRFVATRPWADAHFCVCEDLRPHNGSPADLVLRDVDGSTSMLSEVLARADVVVMVATSGAGADYASAIGRACAQRGVMTAGLVLGEGDDVDIAVAALRPHARVLLPTADESDVTELLTALRV